MEMYNLFTSTSGATDFDSTKFEKIQKDCSLKILSNHSHQEGDIVTYGGYSYIAIRQNTNVTPMETQAIGNYCLTGKQWANTMAVFYRVGDVVTYGGYSYVAIRDNRQVPTQQCRLDTFKQRF